MDVTGLTIRAARPDDHDAVREMTADTWPERPGDDYLGRVYPQWLEAGELPKRTLVADDGGTAVALAQCVRLTEHEAWGQGLRVHPEYRGRGLSRALTAELFDWARGVGASVVRVLVHGWNGAGLGQARSTGYRPVGTFRWVHPDPSARGRAARAVANQPGVDPSDLEVRSDPTAAWAARDRRGAMATMGGLGLSLDETWALAELSPAVLARAAEAGSVLSVHGDRGVAGMAYRTRVFEYDPADGPAETVAEYGLATWDGLAAGAALLDAIAADAAEAGADGTRVVVPETPAFVSDAAVCRAEIVEYPEVVLEADLLGRGPNPARRRRA